MRIKKSLFWIIGISFVLVGMFTVRDLDGRYGRSINGDAKAYYAYLPALFIYNDASYSFIDEVEQTYYPEDRSQFKDFRIEQKNGKSVNKTFPGLSILYAPFFFLSMLVAWIFGFPVDGYSAPFQWGIAFSHLVYFFVGLRFLLAFFRSYKISDTISYWIFSFLLFGTNCWYYLVYDHTVSHIHSFFLACVLLWSMQQWISTKRVKFFGLIGCVMALLVIIRPTNAVMILFLPLLLVLRNVNLKALFSKEVFHWKQLVLPVAVGLAILAIPFLFWKWQSDLWVVYSYGEETFDFKHPHLLEFLFSYEKGWLLWTPLSLFALIGAIIYFGKQSWKVLFLFLMPLMIIIYILSSWWCWTYGSGFGQRPMIEYLPFIALGFAFFAQKYFKKVQLAVLVVPLSGLAMIQSFQIANSILNGGLTTKKEYWSHFLQLKRDAPKAEISSKDQLLAMNGLKKSVELNEKVAYSYTVETKVVKNARTAIVELNIGATNGNRDIRLVLSSKDGAFYKDHFFGDFLYDSPRKMSFKFDLPTNQTTSYLVYVWNGDSKTTAKIEEIKLKIYR